MEQKFDWLIFDLDDTLYPPSSGVFPIVGTNIKARHRISEGQASKVSTVCPLLYKNYGTTLAGLQYIGYDIDYDDFHRFVHGSGLPYNSIKRDNLLGHMLKNMCIRKLIFANSDKDHTVRVLKRLGLEDCFHRIIYFETLNKQCMSQPWDKAATPEIFDIVGHLARSCGRVDKLAMTPVQCKPNIKAMKRTLEMFNVDPSNAVYMSVQSCCGRHRLFSVSKQMIPLKRSFRPSLSRTLVVWSMSPLVDI